MLVISLVVQKDLNGKTTPPREGYVFDRATGKPVDYRKPEEPVRQEYEKILNEDYDYFYDQIDIEVFIQRGSKTTPKNASDRADIVVFTTTEKNKRDQNADILGIVETKRPQREDGIRQLQSYMSASSATWGVWTNGNEIEYLYKEPKSGTIRRDFVFQIPGRGQTWQDIGRITKETLIPASNLRVIFKRILNTLYTNTNISRREKLGNEMIKLIFCKIWDERYYQDKPPKFKIGFSETPEEVAKNVKWLFNVVKTELATDGVFDKTEEIKLEDRSIAIVVGELEKYGLHKTDKDVVGDAFEIFAESKLVGEKGEFFTPREVVRTAISLVQPKPGQKILDPACGSGGFLIYALENIWREMDEDKKYKGSPNLKDLKREIAANSFFGIDKEPDLVKISKAYMAIVGDGRGGIVAQNTLHRPEDYELKPKELFVHNDNTFKKFDIILTNPPFGSKIKVLKEEAKYFDLGHAWKYDSEKGWVKTDRVKPTEPQTLFVERCLEMLDDKGTLAIVLPETYFHAPKVRYVLNYLKDRGNIKAIIDLPHNTFRPHNNAKTILLLFEKGVHQQSKITLGVVEEMGHDHRGMPIYRYDESSQQFTKEIWDDTIPVRKELSNPESPENKYVFTVPIANIKNDMYVPRYYWDKRIKGLEEEAESRNLRLVPVSELIDKQVIKKYRGHGAPPSEFKGRGEVPYVRAADIVNWELYKNPTAMVPFEVYKKIKGKGIDLKAGDIVFVKEGSYRVGTVAIVSPLDINVLLNHHSIVFRVVKENNEYDLTPFYLLYLFSHKLTQKQLFNKIMVDTTLPNIGDRWSELRLPIANDKNERKRISFQIEAAFKKRWSAQNEIVKIKDEFGDFVM